MQSASNRSAAFVRGRAFDDGQVKNEQCDTPTVAASPAAVRQIEEGLSLVSERAEMVLNRLAGRIDRLFGVDSHQHGVAEKALPVYGGEIGEIYSALMRLHGAVSDIEHQLNRLEAV